MNYLIVVFKNRRKKKIINKFNTSKKANTFYKELLEKNDEVLFEVQTQNGKPCVWEIALLERKNDTQIPLFTKDEFGRNVKLEFEDDDYDIIKISPYKEPEKIKDLQTGNKIATTTFINNYLSKEGIKLVSKLNNKIVVQNDDVVKMFVLKSDSDASRFIDALTQRFLNLKRGDCMFVKDTTSQQKKYLYDLLHSQGYDKKFLYRKETTYSSSLSK
jgi:hypothetical protein